MLMFAWRLSSGIAKAERLLRAERKMMFRGNVETFSWLTCLCSLSFAWRVSGGIAKQSTFVQNPPALAFGMSVVLWLGTVFQLIASYNGLNVSATHCIIGGIIGMAMAWGGTDSVYWAEPDRLVAT
jgi:phosphate/sulfate permease